MSGEGENLRADLNAEALYFSLNNLNLIVQMLLT